MASPAANAPEIHLLDHQLLFVTGKGGVGKTTISCALAFLGASLGKRTLLAELDGKHDICELFSVPPADGAIQELHGGLYGLSVDTELALREYLRIFARIPWVGRIGPLARIFDFVATAAPGVKEILTIGKITWEAGLVDPNQQGYPKWDLIVVDGTASGHIVGQLTAHRAIRDMVQVGLIREQTEGMAAILEDHERTAVAIVTTPEEMPVVETIELLDRLAQESRTRAAAVIVNKALPELFTSSEEQVFERLAEQDCLETIGEHINYQPRPYFEAARLAIGLRRSALENLSRLRESVSVPIYYVPYVFTAGYGLRATKILADALAEELS
ncbi:MAG: anion-transporting ATPase [Acidimicrobiia bacterium]|mgnify:CR=1 FL=1